MAKRTEYQGISRRARSLLNKSESIDVDFKETLSGLDAGDLTAFANSPAGGAILIGVREVKDKVGAQRGEPIGCPIGDQARLQILNKALSCIPPVAVEILTENSGSQPFFRVEIPSGNEKPYCTPAGTYKIRGDGRNRPMYPDHLLAVFMDRESHEFHHRFQEAAAGIEAHLFDTASTVADIESSVKYGLGAIEDQLGWAVFHADDADTGIKHVRGQIAAVETRVQRVEDRVVALLAYLKAPDPVKERAKKELATELEKKFREEPTLLKHLADNETITLSGPLVAELGTEESNKVVRALFDKLLPELPEMLKSKHRSKGKRPTRTSKRAKPRDPR